MRTAEAVIFEGEVLQHPTTPVMKLTNMMKNATMKSAIMERPISEIHKRDVPKVRFGKIEEKSVFFSLLCTWDFCT